MSIAQRLVGHELAHLRGHWWWFAILGVLLVVCGTAAIVFPHLTLIASAAVVILLGLALLVGGVATVVESFWAGQWSGLLLQLLVGILYIAAGLVIVNHTAEALASITLFLAVSFVVLGTFRAVAALMLRYPQWGWSLLNGLITFLAGVVIWREWPIDALWVIGLLVGLEMLFNGWTWIMLGMAIRNLPQSTQPSA